MLKTHIESVHEGIKPFKCHICNYKTAAKYFLKRHITLVHQNKNSENKNVISNEFKKVFTKETTEKYACSMCLRSYTFLSHLKCHMRVTHGFSKEMLKEIQLEYDLKENQIKEKLQQEDPLNISNSNSVDLEGDQFVLEKNEQKDTFKCGYLRCPFCLIDFSRKQSLDIHVCKLHGSKKPIENFEKCESCFSDKKSLNAHISKAHIGSKLYRCQICGFRYKTKLKLKKHSVEVHEGKKAPLNEENTCSLCIGSFNDKEDLMKHYAAVHERPQKCDTCGKEFTVIGNLNKHVAKVHAGKEEKHIDEVHERETEKRHKCSLCTFSYKFKESLQVHLEAVHERPKKCDTCGKKFAGIGTLNNHVVKMHGGKVHERKNPFQCSICWTIFADRNLLEEHVLTVHEGHKPYKCDICLSFFNKKYTLKTHIESVHEGKFDCVICDSHFSNEKKLHQHIENVHERKKQGEKKIFQCPNPKCAAKFKGRYSLVKHTRQCSYGPKAHEGNKPCNLEGIKERFDKYSCFICYKSFSAMVLLKRHLKQTHGSTIEVLKNSELENHLTENQIENIEDKKCSSEIIDDEIKKEPVENLKCSICGWVFSEKSKLKRHQALEHEKEYSCIMCNAKFKERILLMQHKKLCIGGKSFSCSICNCNFSKESSLKMHYTMKHLSENQVENYGIIEEKKCFSEIIKDDIKIEPVETLLAELSSSD